MKRLLVLVALAIFMPSPISGAEPGLLFTADFESRNLATFGDGQLEHTLQKARIVDSQAREGMHSLELTLDRARDAERTGHRTDFWIRGMVHRLGEDYWYGFSTRLPDDWAPDALAELFAQWVGGSEGGPSLAIYLYGDQYRIRKRWGEGEDYRNLWSGGVSPDRGKWVDWVFHVRWSAGEDGLIEAWKDGERIVGDKGANLPAGGEAPYFKFGIYKWPWKQAPQEAPSSITRRVLHIDEIRIGDARAGYSGVAPGAATAKASPGIQNKSAQTELNDEATDHARLPPGHLRGASDGGGDHSRPHPARRRLRP